MKQRYKNKILIGVFVSVTVIIWAAFRFGGEVVILMPEFAQNEIDDWQFAQNDVENGQEEFAQVARVIDGDTILLTDGRKVRYIGIDAPETGKKGRGKFVQNDKECYSDEATKLNRQLVGGMEVHLVRDKSDTDRYGRLLRYVYVEGKFINQTLVERGAAIAKRYRPDTAKSNELYKAMRSAKADKVGLWRVCAN